MWYVIQVKSGQESLTCQLIRTIITNGELIDCFFPQRERMRKINGAWGVIKEKLFPGYVFVVTDNPEEIFLKLKSVPKLTKLLGDNQGTFIPLQEKEIYFIQRWGGNDHVASISKVMIEKGNKVKILEGNLKDYEGEIVKVNLHKRIAVVRTTFMGSTTDVHMGIEILQKQE
ncbi:MAG: antiterminator LoaP [Clostridiales bacterium]|nr:antiterminator LoaP [Clostridiales bacterium]